jgi:very-short-patch-repair endonuclease
MIIQNQKQITMTNLSEQRNRFEDIKSHYRRNEQEIMERSALKPAMWHSPYGSYIDWLKLMSPIEQDAWNYIRGFGRMPLYPQYPVGKFFTDFGNPYFKIAIECDGKAFHQDKEKDYKRDCEFHKLGWTVYRVNGSDCHRIVDTDIEGLDSYDREEKLKEVLPIFYKNTVDGLVKALAIKHCNYKHYEHFELPLAMQCLEDRVTLVPYYRRTPESPLTPF